MSNFSYDKVRTERRSCCDVTDQQASHGSREAADSYHARLRHQFRASSSRTERVFDKLLDCVSRLHQQRRQLLHLPGGEQGIPERNQSYDQRHIQESATWNRAEDIYAALIQYRSDQRLTESVQKVTSSF